MYKILNRATGIVTNVEGNWPDTLVTQLLTENNDIIVISLYSNTVKIPFEIVGNTTNDRDWDWKEYRMV